MGQSYDNIDDWKIIKEYKQKKKNKLNDLKDEYRKKKNSFERNKRDLAAKITKKEKELEEKTKLHNKSKLSGRQHARSMSRLSILEGDLDNLREVHGLIDEDIELAKKKHDEIDPLIASTQSEIEKIDEKIKELRKQQEARKKVAGKKAGKTTEECPKKCRIDNIKISCDHSGSRGFTLEVPPHEPDMEIPYLDVISGSSEKVFDIITVDFTGSCDHGKSSSANDSFDHKLFIRNSGYEEYCPRVEVVNSETDTNINRPGAVKFTAALQESTIFSSGNLRLLMDLIFKRDESCKEYDLQFESCKGELPYRARVTAYPKWKWDFAMSFGYQEATKINDSKYNAEKSVWNTLSNLFKSKPENFNEVDTSGKWTAQIKGGYTYDIHKPFEVDYTYSFEDLTKEMGESWEFLNSINDFFSNINGFFEIADYKNKLAKDEGHEIATVTIDYPKIEISGSAEHIERSKSPDIGVKGTFGIGFAPLFGITGEIDIIQVCLSSLGGPFGVFLRKVSNMSIGSKDADGKIDKDKNYVETNLSLKIGAKTNVSGKLEFEADGESTWKALTNDAGSAAGIKGVVAFILKGTAKVKGHIWVVKFECGAEFRTASEDGSSESGIEVDIKGVYVNSNFNAVGEFVFTGLAVIYALYKKAEAEGLTEKSEKTKSKPKNKFGDDEVGDTTDPEHDLKIMQETETYKKHVLFKKRPFKMFEYGNDMAEVNAK